MRVFVRSLTAALFVCAGTAAGPAAELEQAVLAKKSHEILKANCYRCHGQNGANEGGFNYVLDRQQLVTRKKVVPGQPAKSKLFRRLTSEDNPMPPEEEKPRP